MTREEFLALANEQYDKLAREQKQTLGMVLQKGHRRCKPYNTIGEKCKRVIF